MLKGRIIVVLLFGLLAGGCGKKNGNPFPQESLSTRKGIEEQRLRIVVPTDYLPSSVIALFEKETGIKVTATTIQSSWEGLPSLISSPGLDDLFILDEDSISLLVKEGFLEPIDHHAIPNLANLDPKFLNLFFDPGNRFSVPYFASYLGILINTELVDSKIKNFQDVFAPAFSQKIFCVNSPDDLVQIAWFSQKGSVLQKITYSDLEKIQPLISKWLGSVRYLNNANPGPLFESGDVSLGIVWSGFAARLLDSNPKYRWVIPEGPHRVGLDSLAIAKSCLHKEQAEAFINFLLRPDVSRLISKTYGYYNPNLAARKLLSQEEMKNPASYPPFNISDFLMVDEESARELLMLDEWFQQTVRASEKTAK